mgnify:CR=1 FL=1
MVVKLCHKLWPNYSVVDPHDSEGCIEPNGHLGPHKFRIDGGIVEWEYEYCGCDCCKEGDECITYQIIKDERSND